MNANPIELTFPEVKAHLLEAAGWIGADLTSFLQTTFKRGRFFAVAPPNISVTQLQNLESGGLTAAGKETVQNGFRLVEKLTLDVDFAQILKKAVESVPGAAIVGFDVTHLPDPIETNPIDLSQRPFGVLTTKMPKSEAIIEFINEFATAWTTVIMAVDHPAAVRTTKELADCLVLFARAAYDGESFVFWLRSAD